MRPELIWATWLDTEISIGIFRTSTGNRYHRRPPGSPSYRRIASAILQSGEYDVDPAVGALGWFAYHIPPTQEVTE